jgi:hypothetical protein
MKSPELTRLVVEIEKWDWGYSLGVTQNYPGRRGEWFRQEFRHLKFMGNLIRPTRFKLRRVELILIPDEVDPIEGPSRGRIGHLGRSRKQWEPLIGIPASALAPLLTVADRLKFMVLEVSSDINRKADIHSLSLEMTIDDETLNS